MLYFLDFPVFSQPIEHDNPKNIIVLFRTKYSGYNLVSTINSAERRFTEKMVKEIHKLEKYFVSLCQDVILEVLSFGNRRRLAKLERVGRRFHWNIEDFFGMIPFLSLNLLLELGYLFFPSEYPKISKKDVGLGKIKLLYEEI